MNLALQLVNVPGAPKFNPWIEQRLAALHPLIHIDQAQIRLEYRPEASPPYLAAAHLAVPGPDIRAEVIDHTPENALAKLFARLRVHAADRAMRRVRALPARRWHGFVRLRRT